MQGIEDEKLAVIAEAQKKASEEYELLVTDAKQRAGGIVKNAETEAVSRKEEILRQARNEIKEIIVAATARVSGVGSGSDRALYDEFLKKAGGTDGENGN
jgi:ATP synthase B/B'' CF(0).